MHRWLIFVVLCSIFTWTLAQGADWVWEIDPPIPGHDAEWLPIKKLWDRHWDGSTLAEMISQMHVLERKYPKRLEPSLWLARLYLYLGDSQKNNKRENYKRAEFYAVQAHKIDKHNELALKILVLVMPNIENTTYTLKNYGDWIKEAAPLKDGWLVPEMQGLDWVNGIALFAQGAQDHQKLIRAAELFTQIADRRIQDGTAQTWASYANYEVGEYYSSIGKHDTQALPFYRKGMTYGDKALKLMPHSVPAHYWYFANLGRSVENTSLLNQARYLDTMLKHISFCARENGFYNYFGSAISLATIITKGGWVVEKGFSISGVGLESICRSLDLTEILYPQVLRLRFAKADISAYQNRREEAIQTCERIMRTNPQVSSFTGIGNCNSIGFAQQLYNKLK